MGSVVSGWCDCGYETEEMHLGGGMMNHTTYCGFPHYCEDCQTLFVENIYEEVVCPDCQSGNVVAYDNARVSTLGRKRSFDWHSKHTIGRNLILNASGNLCPKCKKYDLIFGAGFPYD